MCLVYKDSNGKRHVQQFRTDWYFMVPTEAMANPVFDMMNEMHLIHRTEPYVMDGKFTKIYCQNRNLYRRQIDQGETDAKGEIVKYLRQADIPTYEADLTSLKRLMIDREILVSDRYKVINLDIETQDATPDGRRLPINVGAYPILSFSVELSNGKQYFVTHKSEEFLLYEMQKFLDAADLVTTWNGNKFDVPYIKERMSNYRMFYSWKRLIHVDYVRTHVRPAQVRPRVRAVQPRLHLQ